MLLIRVSDEKPLIMNLTLQNYLLPHLSLHPLSISKLELSYFLSLGIMFFEKSPKIRVRNKFRPPCKAGGGTRATALKILMRHRFATVWRRILGLVEA